jgi:hypothetical protein
MKIIKKVTYTFLAICIALGVYVVIGSIDAEVADDHGLLDNRISVSDVDNGFLVVKYTEVEGYELLDREHRKELKGKITSQSWDADYAQTQVSKHSKAISDFLHAAEYKHFKFHPLKNADDLPNYMPILDMMSLVILQSRLSAEQGSGAKAIALAEKALYMSQQIKVEANGYLISYMIGLVMQYESLQWFHRLAYDYDLDDEKIGKLLVSINQIPPIEHDGFEAVFAGEVAYSKVLAEQMVDESFKERWEIYKNEEDYWNSDLDGDLELGRENFKQELYILLSTLIPRFYLHKNRFLSAVAKDYKGLAEQSRLYCNKVAVPTSEYEEHKLSWIELVQSNSGLERRNADPAQFSHYFYRRCLGYAQVESVKTLLAIKRFYNAMGVFPDALIDLVPKYLNKLPVDPFDGQRLKYSKDDMWVYSLGKNFEDNGGDVSGCYFHRCYWDEACASNPTFPAAPKVCLDYEEGRSEKY